MIYAIITHVTTGNRNELSHRAPEWEGVKFAARRGRSVNIVLLYTLESCKFRPKKWRISSENCLG